MDAMLDHVELTCEVSFALDGVIDKVEGVYEDVLPVRLAFVAVAVGARVAVQLYVAEGGEGRRARGGLVCLQQGSPRKGLVSQVGGTLLTPKEKSSALDLALQQENSWFDPLCQIPCYRR